MNTFSEQLEKVLKKRSWIRYPLYLVQDFLTPVGRIFIICTMLSAPLSFVAINTTAYFFFTMITSILITGFIINFIYRPDISCTRYLPGLMETNNPISYQVHLVNKGKRNAYLLKIKEVFWSINITFDNNDPVEIITTGNAKISEVKFTPKKRGIYYSDGIIITSSFPFNLFNWGKFIPSPGKIVVFPSYQRLESFEISLGRKFQPGGIALSSNVGDSTEFIGTRDYVSGDNPRHIHWKSWARTGKPVVKEFQEEYFVRLAMILDTQATKSKSFEEALSMAASIADYLSRYDYIIDIFATGNQIHHFQAGRALAHFDNILELLACIEPAKNVDFRELFASLSIHLANLSAIFFIFLDWDEQREQIIRELLENGIGVKAFVFSEKTTKAIPVELSEIVKINL